MTWKRMLVVMFFLMLAGLLAAFFFNFRQEIPGSSQEVLGVRSLFPAGPHFPVADAKNGWQGFAFTGHFRFFRRASLNPREDFQKLKLENFPASPLQTDLDLFAGGLYVMQKANKGYRMFCLFYRGGMLFWADMVSASSMDLGCRAFERFILNLEIEGQGVYPTAAAQIASLHRRISPFFMQTPGQLLAVMAAIFVLVILIAYLANRFSGSCPRRADLPPGECTPYATLRVGGFGRRKITACCLCREGEFLVIYRFRRPYMKIDIGSARQDIIWEKTSFRYQNIRVIMNYEDFQHWQSLLMV